ncbi:MAG: recombinase family protein [Oligoflexia bacterium]|nr:recombinase family protein [Oligoflexia bacterium]
MTKAKEDEVKICAIYGRTSVADEVENGSLEQQKQMGIATAQRLSESTGIEHRVEYILIEDRGISGGTTNRPKYQQLLNLIRTHSIDAIFAKEISRLNRNTKEFFELIELCNSKNIAIYIRGLDINAQSPMDNIQYQILAAMLEIDKAMFAKKIKSGIRSTMQNNKKICGGPVILGFDIHPNKKGTWMVNEEENKKVIFMMKTFNEILSYEKTIKKANEHGIKNKNGFPFLKDGLKRLLTNRKYIGKLNVPVDPDMPAKEVDLPFGATVPVQLFKDVQKNVHLVKENN